MKKAEALKIVVNLRTTYQELKGCTEGKDENNKGVKYIPTTQILAPSIEQIKALSDFIIENEDRGLYEKTFGMMDLDLLNKSYWKLQEIWGHIHKPVF